MQSRPGGCPGCLPVWAGADLAEEQPVGILSFAHIEELMAAPLSPSYKASSFLLQPHFQLGFPPPTAHILLWGCGQRVLMLPASLQPLSLPCLTFGFNFSLLTDVQTGSQGLSTSRNKPQQKTSIPTDRGWQGAPTPLPGQ